MFFFALLCRQSGKKAYSIRGIEDKLEFVQAWTDEDHDGEFPLGEGRQTETTLSATKSDFVLSHTPSLIGGWKRHDLVVLHQGMLSGVTVGTKRKTSSIWTRMQITIVSMITQKG